MGVYQPVTTHRNSTVVRPTITTTDTIYTAGDNLGGIIDLGALATASGSPVTLNNLVLKDAANQKPDLFLIFFRSSPAGTYTDNLAAVISVADTGNIVHMTKVLAADWTTVASRAIASYSFDSGITMGPAASNLYLAIVVGTTVPDYGANATDLTAEISFSSEE